MNLEPIGSSSVSTSRLAHANGQTFLESAGLAGGSVSLVNNTHVVILAIRNHCLVVAKSSKETLASLACEGSKVETCSFFIANSAELVLKRIDAVDLVLTDHGVSRG